MKLYFKALALSCTIHFCVLPIQARAILMSGNQTFKERSVSQRITKNLIGETSLVTWEKNNPLCKRRKGYLLQLCWQGLRMKVIYQKKLMLKNSVARIMNLKKLEKAFIKKASL